MEMTLNANFLAMENNELELVNGGSWATVLGAIVLGVIGIVAGPPAWIVGSTAITIWYAGCGILAIAGVLSALGY